MCRSVLMKSICSANLSLERDRADMISHQNERARRLHNAEGSTYLFIKEYEFRISKNYFSDHKHQNLIKSFMIVYSDGYIADIFGPYTGSTNDASIMIDLLKKDIWSSF